MFDKVVSGWSNLENDLGSWWLANDIGNTADKDSMVGQGFLIMLSNYFIVHLHLLNFLNCIFYLKWSFLEKICHIMHGFWCF